MNTLPALITYIFLSIFILGTALAAVALRDIVHCGLSLALSFVGLGLLYLYLGAEFIGFIQILVYVGAIAILIMFVILLTRQSHTAFQWNLKEFFHTLVGVAIAAAVFLALAISIVRSPSLHVVAPASPIVSIPAIGEMLVTTHLLPLQATGVLLTVALIAAVIFAFQENSKK